MNLHEKLLKVKEGIDYLKKESQGSQYKYVSSSQVLGTVRKLLNDNKILLIPEVVDSKVMFQEVGNDTKKTRTYFTELFMNMVWVDVEKPDDKIICKWYGQGVDIAGEKGVGKALTYAEKYFLLKFFNIPTDKDDPDAFQKKYEEPEKIDIKTEIANASILISNAMNITDLKKCGLKIANIKHLLSDSQAEDLRNKYEIRKTEFDNEK